MDQHIIRCTNLGCRFPRVDRDRNSERHHWVYRHVSFDLRKGETFGVVGRNGEGKSSLLQTLAFILKPSEGKVEATTRRITLLSVNAGLQPNLSGRMNARLSGMLLGFSSREIADRLEAIKAFSDLGDAFEQRVSTYSAGMRARLGFSTAAQLEPDVLLIDEALGAGDQEFREKSTRIMRKKLMGDLTVVFVSHNLPMVAELCDRTLWLDQGRIAALGKTDQVISEYRRAIQQESVAS